MKAPVPAALNEVGVAYADGKLHVLGGSVLGGLPALITRNTTQRRTGGVPALLSRARSIISALPS